MNTQLGIALRALEAIENLGAEHPEENHTAAMFCLANDALEALAAYWPSLADVPCGRDVFPHLPIAGLPDGEILASLVCDGHMDEEGEN